MESKKIIDKVYELCPELKKLEFGCDVFKKGKKYTYIHIIEDPFAIEHQMMFLEKKRGGIITLLLGYDEIIGKPITLHYLLKAVNKRCELEIESEKDSPIVKGVMKHAIANSFNRIFKLWNFNLEDNLETQLKNHELKLLLKEILL